MGADRISKAEHIRRNQQAEAIAAGALVVPTTVICFDHGTVDPIPGTKRCPECWAGAEG